jgi:hypothetical protein
MNSYLTKFLMSFDLKVKILIEKDVIYYFLSKFKSKKLI